MREYDLKFGLTRYGQLLYAPAWGGPGRALHTYGEYSESEVAIFREFKGQGKLALDIGANIGAHTLALARIFDWVNAFERSPNLARLCSANLTLNDINNAEVLCGDAAELLRDWPMANLDFVKIDVDGPELEIMQALEPAIIQFEPALYLENDVIATSEAKIEYLYDLGYQPYWHLAPFYNQQNILNAPCKATDSGLASIMMLGLPQGQPCSLSLTKVQLGDTARYMSQEGDHVKLIIDSKVLAVGPASL